HPEVIGDARCWSLVNAGLPRPRRRPKLRGGGWRHRSAERSKHAPAPLDAPLAAAANIEIAAELLVVRILARRVGGRRLAMAGRPLAGGARSAGDAESGERLLIRHAGLLQSLLPLELAQSPLGHRSELAVEVSHLETLLLQRLLDLPDLALARVICRALTALFIGIFIRQLPAALRLSLLRLRLLLCLLRLWLRLGPLLCLLLRRLLRLRLLLCLLLRRLLRLRLLLCLL